MSDALEAVRGVASNLMAALAGFSQTQRLLRLTTPLGPNTLLAERFSAVEAVSGLQGLGTEPVSGFRLHIVALSTNAHLPPKALLGYPVRLDVLTDQGPSHTRPFHGHVTAFEQLGSNGGLARYRLTVEPWLALLRHQRDSQVFQQQSIVQIIDTVLGDTHGKGQLAPVWRWQLAEPEALPQRSLCIQHGESDHQFVQRLLAEEGLFAWFEHSADAHTWVIADTAAGFGQAGVGATGGALGSVRFQRAAATEAADTLQRFNARASLGTQAVELRSWDYVSLDTRPVGYCLPHDGALPTLTRHEHVGHYGYPHRRHGERLARRRSEAHAAARGLIAAGGTVRRLAAGSTLLLTGHPRYNAWGLDDERRQFAAVRVEHHGRNNLPADFSAALDRLFERDQPQPSSNASASNEDTPLYENHLHLHPLSEPYAALPPAQRHTVRGSLTATVVGTPGLPVTTDRDHRVRLQFHFARGTQASSRASHPSGRDSAPGTEHASPWVRVATPVAGDNWGGHFIPRVGQEVVVQFLDGDIDRPVVTGAVYNGVGAADAPGNTANQSAPAHTANAPAWFAGNGHGPVFSGIKSMALGESATGQGGYNHLRFDDTPGQSSTQLATTAHATTLTLGHHRGQRGGGQGLAGNERTRGLGFGASLETTAYGALRGGTGVLISANDRPLGSFGPSLQMDAAEAIQQLSQGERLAHALIETAQSQQAGGPSPSTAAKVVGGAEVTAALQTLHRDLHPQGDTHRWGAPHLVHSAPGGIAQLTAGVSVHSAGGAWVGTAAVGNELVAQGASRVQAAQGIRLFAYGSPPVSGSTITTQGLRLHAAQGAVKLQASSDRATLAARQDLRLASTEDSVELSAKKHLLLTAGGAYIKLSGSSIQLHAPGTVTLKGSMKTFTSAKSGKAATVALAKPKKMRTCDTGAERAANKGGALVKVG